MTSGFLTGSFARSVFAASLTLAVTGGLAASASAQDAQRITSIGSSVTEIVYALGEEKRLVAVDTTSSFPLEAKKLPNVGYMRALSAEGLLAIEPDLVLMVEGSGPQTTLDVLEQTNVPMVSIPANYTLEGVLEKVKLVADALGVEAKGAALSEQIQRDIAALEGVRGDKGSAPSVLYVHSVKGDRLMVSGEGTAAHAAIGLAGAKNVMGGFKGYKQVSIEALLEAQPDIILSVQIMPGTNTQDALKKLSGIELTPAGKNDAFISMDGVYLLGFGPRSASAMKDLALKINDLAS